MKEAHTIVQVPMHLYTPTVLRRHPQPKVRIGCAYRPPIIVSVASEASDPVSRAPVYLLIAVAVLAVATLIRFTVF